MAFLFGEWYMCGGIITNRYGSARFTFRSSNPPRYCEFSGIVGKESLTKTSRDRFLFRDVFLWTEHV